ncbi:DNA recombination protein RmuC [Streptococcus sciuri]|uniref:DNA recombination protein RmuC n=1 Tax=Streptococcus sciuri TaxID=2973939 RepID=A0ABT2FAW6_9STRE|nr:DNA recombination protein RmuC [Streptococcus sciuri]MCS4488940.1 DNA recombination protein RmuC [Streptococcus sciuri]
MSIFIFLIALVTLVTVLFLLKKIEILQSRFQKNLENYADNLSEQLSYQANLAQKEQLLALNQQLSQVQNEIYAQLADIRDVLHRNLLENRDRTDKRLQDMTDNLNRSVKNMQLSNEDRLEQMRQTVEEKLEKTLQTRLQVSFETVSKQLESVNQGLGEMKSVAKDVGSLNKVLSSTKTRGIMGELQLGQIIEDILTESQYEREFSTVKGSSERVEYAIKLPGAQNHHVYLPIDSKFPLEDYYRLEDAYELGDKEIIEKHRKALLSNIKRFAKDIHKKYLHPPETTNFGILFLPTEGLYAEVVRNATFFDRLRRDENIIVAGPTTLSALLNSLQVGFKTLTIQKNADDISKVLGNVKVEFGKFSAMLQKAQKQLNTASKSIDSLLTTRTDAITRALHTIENYQDQDTQRLLAISPLQEEQNED